MSDSATTPTSTAKMPLVGSVVSPGVSDVIRVVRLARLEPPGDSKRHGRLVDGGGQLSDVSRLDGDRQLQPRPEKDLELAERDHGEVVLRPPQEGASLRADANHPEMDAFDLNQLVQRIDSSEQEVRDFPSDHGNGA